MRNILVVYYSWGNNIKAVAEYLSQKLGADLLELKPKEAYPTDYDACLRKVGRDGAAYEPELEGKTSDLSSYNGVFVGSPCWWGTIANPVRTFLHQDDFSGKTVVLFMTHATSGLHVQDVAKLCPGAKVLNGHGVFNSYQVSTKKTRRKIWEITRRILTGGFERSDSDISFLRRPTIFNKKI